MNISSLCFDTPELTSIYLISDIHSNLPALETVLKEIPQNATIVCAGDIVGYYLEPNEVCESLRNKSVLCVKGNHDKYVLKELPYRDELEEKYRINFTRQALNKKNIEWLSSFPDMLILKIVTKNRDGNEQMTHLRITHGSPRNIEEYIYPDTPIEFLTADKPEFLILGHTHHPMLRSKNKTIIINPGSVGQTRDKIPGASYALLNLHSQQVFFRRTQYPINIYQQTLKKAGVNQAMIEILSKN